MKSLRVAIVGASGRMGQGIAEIAGQFDLTKQLAVSRNNKISGYKKNTDSIDAKDFSKVQVVIDFSAPAVFDDVLRVCIEKKLPLVSGTTGLSRAQLNRIKSSSKKIPILWAPNMSLGVAILRHALRACAGAKGFDIQILEKHHVHKKDSPSGTAILLRQDLERYTRKKIPVRSIREGEEVGFHQVTLSSPNEEIVLSHQARDRKLFAEGAILAAQWIKNKKPGLYKMENVLGFE